MWQIFAFIITSTFITYIVTLKKILKQIKHEQLCMLFRGSKYLKFIKGLSKSVNKKNKQNIAKYDVYILVIIVKLAYGYSITL